MQEEEQEQEEEVNVSPENLKKIMEILLIIAIISIMFILLWQVKNYYDTAVYFRELYLGCKNTSIDLSMWGVSP